jgi:hypothetical protein
VVSEDRVIALLGEGNPIPEPMLLGSPEVAAVDYLASLEEIDSGPTLKQTVVLERATTRRWVLGLVGGVAVLMLVLVGLMTARRQGSTFWIGEVEPAVEATVEEWQSTYNNGDVDAHLSLFTEGAVVNGTLLRFSPEFRDGLAWDFGWNPVIDLIDCQEIRPATVSCHYSETTDFWDPVGVEGSGSVEIGLDVEDDYRIAWVDFREDPLSLTALQDFEDAFLAWAETRHPEVELTGLSPSRDREVWIGLRDDFLVESPDYPLPTD